MDTIADLVAAGRDREGPALTASGRGAPYGYDEFCTNVWKAGNLLRHYGVRPGAEMAVVVGPKEPAPDEEPGDFGQAADPLLAILGGAMLGASVNVTPTDPIEGRAVVLPAAWVDRYEVEPGCSRLGYGGPPEAADVAHWETELWSENPIEPPDPVAADDPFFRVADAAYTQGELVAAATTLAKEHDLASGDTVVVDAPLTDAGTLVAGVLAPLSAGATIVPGDVDEPAEDVEASAVYVVRAGGSETGVVDPVTVL